MNAEVAELADALDSGSSALTGVRVQIPASAPTQLLCRAGEASPQVLIPVRCDPLRSRPCRYLPRLQQGDLVSESA
ncbi:protein of unknown function [Candidatus Nitrospira inopinata]|uniref:Uncharacterized protein n=1 Tax=Candidatus Nitrospira inopinata TaxID=1715989 RepID=A0A0S4KS26_9BACT|nr:protein of unknown function [Candidatus Nitrospira inopinata]